MSEDIQSLWIEGDHHPVAYKGELNMCWGKAFYTAMIVLLVSNACARAELGPVSDKAHYNPGFKELNVDSVSFITPREVFRKPFMVSYYETLISKQT